MKNPYLQEATEIIRKQQGPRGPVWMCGEQLLEMIAPDEAAAKLVLDDLKHSGMSLKGCEAEIRAFACKTGAAAPGRRQRRSSENTSACRSRRKRRNRNPPRRLRRPETS